MDHLIKGQTKWGEHFFCHTRRAATFGIRVPIPIVEMTSV